MGRGRAKAKQTKVARELKYSSPKMDLDALQREIGSGTAPAATAKAEVDGDDEYADPYAYDVEDDDYPRR
jgi:Protein of unknown function (DUF3073)